MMQPIEKYQCRMPKYRNGQVKADKEWEEIEEMKKRKTGKQEKEMEEMERGRRRLVNETVTVRGRSNKTHLTEDGQVDVTMREGRGCKGVTRGR
ncbi:hypothetical protein WR25_11096 [Diploscapter pachys]|uniref:Uncharacterized protein n=1 Tax=Diploscapter pachys TaxID=2018661 RepID=A0A2A2L7J6_9BILA|nr:hypothetical protein WR25_11096 [Diploscapter pachys]